MNNTKIVDNGFSYEKNGWKYVSIRGPPRERGHAYGLLCAKEFTDIQRTLNFNVLQSFGKEWSYFVEEINKDFKAMTETDFPEYYEEMQGIAEGCVGGGCTTTIDEILAWNFYCSMEYWLSSKTDGGGAKEGGAGAKDRCSAFIAVGDWTADGKIVVAHNSFCEFIDGQCSNIVLDLNPPEGKGHRFIMQTSPCWIWSGTDFFVNAAGIIGTETTIGGFNKYEKNVPVGYRIRNAMQYANNMDECVGYLRDGNSGDYANSWLFGDTNTNEILRIELGLKYDNVERTKNGFFIGFNAAYDPRIRNLECNNHGFFDIRRHQGARHVRLNELMDLHKGKLNIEIAKQIISDHHDVYLDKDDHPCSRTVCSHYDLDAREYMSQADRPTPYKPQGAVDGIVCDTTMAEKMSFSARFGNSCGTNFNKTEFCKKHIQWAMFEPYLKDRPSQPWTDFSTSDSATDIQTPPSIPDNNEATSVSSSMNEPSSVSSSNNRSTFSNNDFISNIHFSSNNPSSSRKDTTRSKRRRLLSKGRKGTKGIKNSNNY
jgi:hypothetical protein